MQNKNQSYHLLARNSLSKILLQCKKLTQTHKRHKRYSSQQPNYSNLTNRNNLNPINRSDLSLHKKNDQVQPRSTKRKKLYQVVRRRNNNYGPKNASKSKIVCQLKQHRQPRCKTDLLYDEGYVIYQRMVEQRKKLQDMRRIVILSKIIKQNIKKKNNQIQIKNKIRLRQK